MKKIISGFVIFFFVLIILLNIFSIYNKSFFGYRAFIISSGSMKPYLKVNDFIIDKTNKNYEVNDVITYYDGNNYITHRIVEKKGNIIITKGDANNTVDIPFDESQIIGKVVFKLRIIGFISYLIKKPLFWILIFLCGLVITAINSFRKEKIN